MVMKVGKHQRNKQRCQDLGWKVDRAECFVLRSCTINYVLIKKEKKKIKIDFLVNKL